MGKCNEVLFLVTLALILPHPFNYVSTKEQLDEFERERERVCVCVCVWVGVCELLKFRPEQISKKSEQQSSNCSQVRSQ